MYATAVPGRCPIECYKFYADRRPADFCNPDHPFYLAIVTNKREPQLTLWLRGGSYVSFYRWLRGGSYVSFGTF